MSVRLLDRLQVSPKSVLAIGMLFVGIGLLDLYWGLAPLLGGAARWEGDALAVFGIGLAALIGGLWTLMGCNWARWLLSVWMLLHIALSAFDPWTLVIHAAIFAIVIAVLFNPIASRYFRSEKGG